jgi:cytochrome c
MTARARAAAGIVVVLAAVFVSEAARPRLQESPAALEARRGRGALAERRCGACHVIPGVRAANGVVGPSLERFGRRSFIAGRLPNTPENLRIWIREPRHVDAETAMPELGVGDEEARAMAAYLATLR